MPEKYSVYCVVDVSSAVGVMTMLLPSLPSATVVATVVPDAVRRLTVAVETEAGANASLKTAVKTASCGTLF